MVLALWEYEKTILHRQKIHISWLKDDIGPNNGMFMTFTLLKKDPQTSKVYACSSVKTEICVQSPKNA
mgnify:CR=1 FL=1